MIVLLVILIIVWCIGAVYLGSVFYYKLTRREVFVPFIPADHTGIESMCESINLKGDEKVIDVGSGWGSIIFHLLRKYPKLDVTGVELNPVLHLFSTIRAKLFHQNQKITLYKQDAVKLEYKKYDVIFLFMLSSFVNKVLVPKFEKELVKGTKVISYVFPMKSDKFREKKIELPTNGWKSVIYVYEKL